MWTFYLEHITRRRSTSFKIGKFQDTPYGQDMYFFNIFINNGRICIGFEVDRVEKVHKLAYFIRFSEKCLTKNYRRAKGKKTS